MSLNVDLNHLLLNLLIDPPKSGNAILPYWLSEAFRKEWERTTNWISDAIPVLIEGSVYWGKVAIVLLVIVLIIVLALYFLAN